MQHRRPFWFGVDVTTLTHGYIRQVVMPLFTSWRNIPVELNFIIATYNLSLYNPTIIAPLKGYSGFQILQFKDEGDMFIKYVYKSADSLFIHTSLDEMVCYRTKNNAYSLAKHAFFRDKPIAFVSSSHYGKHAIVGTKHSVFAFGANKCGQLGVAIADDAYFAEHIRQPTQMVLPLHSNSRLKIIDAACGDQFTVLLTQCGRVLTCGRNNVAQCGLPQKAHSDMDEWEDFSKIDKLTLVPQLADIVAIACGQAHTLCLDRYGRVFSFGENGFSQCGHSLHKSDAALFIAHPKLIKYIEERQIRIQQISCGAQHSCVLDINGRAYFFGRCESDIHDDDELYLLPCFVLENLIIKKVDCGERFTLFLSNQHELFCMGSSVKYRDKSDDAAAQAPGSFPSNMHPITLQQLGVSPVSGSQCTIMNVIALKTQFFVIVDGQCYMH